MTTSSSPIVVQPPQGWQLIDFRELWKYKELLYFLAWRDVKVRYKQMVLGAAWSVLQPVATMIVFTVVFGYVVGVGRHVHGVPYPLFVFSGLLPWNLFSGGMAGASNSVLASSSVITKIYFPRIFIPIAAIGVNLVNFAISLVVLLVLMAGFVYFGDFQIAIGLHLLLLPLVVLLILMATLSIGVGLSALMVTYRDFRHVAPFLVQILLYLTPVIYPVTMIPEQFRWIIALNPMTGLIDAFRYSLLSLPFQWYTLAISAAITVVAFVGSAFFFRRAESRFADII